MERTPVLNMKKPDYLDPPDIRDINENMDVLDAEVGAVRLQLTPEKEKAAPAEADTFVLTDSADDGKKKQLTFANLWAYLLTKIETMFYTKVENDAQLAYKANADDVNTQLSALTGKVTGFEGQIAPLICNGAAAHNAIYRGKNLGTAVTAGQYAAISAGTFDDLYIGDYWTIGGVNYRIAAFDYYLNYGDGQPQYGGKTCTVHHLVMVPDTCLYGGTQMNASNTTVGGYLGSQMYTQGLEQAKTIIRSAFGEHLLSHRIMLTNAVSNGVPTGSVVVDSEVDLMNEQMVYGNGIFAPVSSGTNSVGNFRYETSQLPLFFFDRTKLNIGVTYWLRDVVNTSDFAAVHVTGAAEGRGAVSTQGVRPSFCIY